MIPLLNRGGMMKGFVQGADRQQTTLLPECLDDWVDESNPVRAGAQRASKTSHITQGLPTKATHRLQKPDQDLQNANFSSLLETELLDLARSD